jgi:hypothetical protein
VPANATSSTTTRPFSLSGRGRPRGEPNASSGVVPGVGASRRGGVAADNALL